MRSHLKRIRLIISVQAHAFQNSS
uniref:Uncharacterized protein n=1 Tax=Anguilla anguilla TaxID=7936 RepID=A0A0E9U619_ANGAN